MLLSLLENSENDNFQAYAIARHACLITLILSFSLSFFPPYFPPSPPSILPSLPPFLPLSLLIIFLLSRYSNGTVFSEATLFCWGILRHALCFWLHGDAGGFLLHQVLAMAAGSIRLIYGPYAVILLVGVQIKLHVDLAP